VALALRASSARLRRSWRALVLALAAFGAPALAQAPPALAPLRFLLGTWESVPAGDPAAGTGRATFAAAAQGRVIVRTSYAEYPAAAGRPASRHDDVMTIYVERETVRAHYVDSEDHVIRYVVTTPASDRAVFLSEAVAGEPRYRLTYTAVASGAVDGRFEIAPPGAPEAFRTYLSWTTRRVN